MKHLFLGSLILLLSIHFSFGQEIDEKLSKQYIHEHWDALSIVKLIDAIDFKPTDKRFKDHDIKYFKAAILNMSENDLEIFRRKAWYQCSAKHKEMHELWNLFYREAKDAMWNKFCKGLLILMILDNKVS